MGSINHSTALFILGVALGKFLPTLPEPVAFVNQYVPAALILIAVYLFIKG